jgi:hypothetical protein
VEVISSRLSSENFLVVARRVRIGNDRFER